MTIIQSCLLQPLVKIEFRSIAAIFIGVLISPGIVEGSRFEMTEDAALALLQRTLKQDRVYEKRTSLDCIVYATEETTKAYFEFVLREIHDAKCGGDPETSPALDRYRVYRRSRKIEQWEPAKDKWRPYKAAGK